MFAQMLTRIDRLPRVAFPLDDIQYDKLQAAVDVWKELALGYVRDQERARGMRHDRGPELGLDR